MIEALITDYRSYFLKASFTFSPASLRLDFAWICRLGAESRVAALS